MCSLDSGLWCWDAITPAACDDPPSQHRGRRGLLSFSFEVRACQGMVTSPCKSLLLGVRAPNRYEGNVQHDESSAFFLHGQTTTGKTFSCDCLASFFMGQGKIVLCVASSGIAAQLLPGGRTAPSPFKIPLSNDINAVCNISNNSFLAQLIRKPALIIWDQIPMQHKACFEAVNRTLNDIRKVCDTCTFGRIPTVLSCDSAQILRVIRRGSRQATVLACIQHGSIWNRLQILKHKTTM